MWKLFLDDERELPHCLVGRGFTVARTVDQAKSLTMTQGMPSEIWLDHDLGHNAPGGDAPAYVKWLIEMILNNQWQRAATGIVVRVHSHNAVGAKNMAGLWSNFCYHATGKEVVVPYTPYHPNMPYNVEEYTSTRWIV